MNPMRGLLAVAACLAPVVACGLLAGCEWGSNVKSPPPKDQPPVVKNDAPAPRPVCEGWPKPVAVLVLSGQQKGYLEPCGCSETQSGGVGRRADLLRQLKEKGWPVAAFDLGGTIRRDRAQSHVKFATVLNTLKDMGYAALGLGPDELRLGADHLVALNVFDPDKQEQSLYLSANATFFGAADLEVGPVRSRIVEVGGRKIGVTSVVVPDPREPLFPEGAQSDVSLEPYEAAVRTALETITQAKPDLKLLMASVPRDQSKKLAETFPDFDVIFATGPEEPHPEPEKVGRAWIVQVGHKGKHVGVLGLYPDDPEQKLRWELVDLDNVRFRDTEALHRRMHEYQDRLKAERLVATEPPLKHPSGHGFVGAQTCGTCHKKAYEKWSGSKHAHAFESLSKGRKGQEATWIDRRFDAECLACHVTGWNAQEMLRYETGFVNEEFVDDADEKARMKRLAGQQCENCHGPGSRHVELEESYRKDRAAVDDEVLRAGRKALQLTAAAAEKDVCRRCHDLDNSPKFDFPAYWEKVRHPWKD